MHEVVIIPHDATLEYGAPTNSAISPIITLRSTAADCVTGAPLIVEFEKLFERRPREAEADIILEADMLANATITDFSESWRLLLALVYWCRYMTLQLASLSNVNVKANHSSSPHTSSHFLNNLTATLKAQFVSVVSTSHLHADRARRSDRPRVD